MAAETKPVRLTYGIHDLHVEVDSLAVAEVAIAYQSVLNLPTNCEAYVNGLMATGSTIVGAGDRIEFIKIKGRKGQDFWSKKEVMAITGISEAAWGQLKDSGMKVVLIDGVEVLCDAEFKKWTQRMIFNDGTIERAAKVGRGGRPNTTADIAEFANRLKKNGKTYKEIVQQWREEHPLDQRVKSSEQVRGIRKRHFRK